MKADMHIVNPESPRNGPARRRWPPMPRSRRDLRKVTAALRTCRGSRHPTGYGALALQVVDLEGGLNLNLNQGAGA